MTDSGTITFCASRAKALPLLIFTSIAPFALVGAFLRNFRSISHSENTVVWVVGLPVVEVVLVLLLAEFAAILTMIRPITLIVSAQDFTTMRPFRTSTYDWSNYNEPEKWYKPGARGTGRCVIKIDNKNGETSVNIEGDIYSQTFNDIFEALKGAWAGRIMEIGQPNVSLLSTAVWVGISFMASLALVWMVNR